MRQRVITGSHGYPGASMVEYEDGHQQFLVSIPLIGIPNVNIRIRTNLLLSNVLPLRTSYSHLKKESMQF